MRLLLPQMIFYAAGAVLTGLLNAPSQVRGADVRPDPQQPDRDGHVRRVPLEALGSQVDLLDLTTGDKLLLGIGTTLGVMTMTLVLWPFVLRLKDQAYSPREFDYRNPAIRHVGNLAKYSLAYVVVNQIGLWVVYALANGVTGGVTAFQSSFILYQLPYGIFAVSVFTALVPTLSEHHVRGDLEAFRRDLSLGLRTTMFVIAPAAAGFIVLCASHRPVAARARRVRRGSTELFADTFLLMAVGLVGYAAFQQLMRASYARQDTRTPWIVNSLAVVLNIALAFPLYEWRGVPGLALAHAISYVFAAFLGGVVLRRQLGGLDGARIGVSTMKIIFASAVSATAAWLVAKGVAETRRHRSARRADPSGRGSRNRGTYTVRSLGSTPSPRRVPPLAPHGHRPFLAT